MLRNLILILTFPLLLGCNFNKKEKLETDSFPILTGKYMGQKQPGLKSEIFAPNIISTGMAEINSVFTSNYSEFYYSIRMPNRQLVIMVMKYDGEQWSEPKVASFSGEYSDADPFISYDGKWLYYISKRPIDSTQTAKEDWDIWRCFKNGDKWSNPERLGSEINNELDQTYPCLTLSGKLYFSSELIKNKKDIFYAENLGKDFKTPVRLSETINSHWEGDIFISPKEEYMIFSSFGRKTGSGLYITFNENGQWTLPKRMSEDINKTGREFCPIVSPDGLYFFFTSNHSVNTNNTHEKLTYQSIKDDFIQSYNHPQKGKTDIYWVDAKIIEHYRNTKQ